MAEYLHLAKDTPFLMYHAIGNHDHCHKYENDYEAEAEYRKYFGPTYYSFNIGKVHYVVLDDHALPRTQQVRQDHRPGAARMALQGPPGARSRNPAARRGLPRASRSQQRGLGRYLVQPQKQGRTVRIVAGLRRDHHDGATGTPKARRASTTGSWNTSIRPSPGNWWYRQGICCNGYPAAFTEYVFRGDRLESRSLIDWANGNSKQQYRVYNKGVTSNTGIASSSALDPAGGAPSVLVFFWGVAPNWTFVCRENGEQTYGRGQLVQRYDPLARSLVEEGIIPYERYTWLKQKPVRLYLYTPKDPGAEIEIVGTDHIRNRDFRVVTRIER